MNHTHSRRRNVIFVLVVGALVIAVHLGLATGLIAMSGWTGWVAYLVLALVVLAKVALVVLGRRHVRRRKADGS